MENNFYEKLKDTKQIFSEEEERFAEEMKRKEQQLFQELLEKKHAQEIQDEQRRVTELSEMLSQKSEYQEDRLNDLGSGKSR